MDDDARAFAPFVAVFAAGLVLMAVGWVVDPVRRLRRRP